MNNIKPTATIQIDVDELWVILKFIGITDVRDTQNVYKESMPRMLDLFDQYGVKATFFIVGRDLEDPVKADMVKKMYGRGHEIANHSFNHHMGLADLMYEEKRDCILECDKRIADVIGEKPCGFRSPGYSIDNDIMDILEENGYLYDSSIFPFFYSNFIKFVFAFLFKRKLANSHYGNFMYGFSPLSIYHPDKKKLWKRGDRKIFEVPVSVTPFLRIPIHAAFVYMLNPWYFRFCYSLIRMRSMDMNYLFHGIELMDDGMDDRFPGFFKIKQRSVKNRIGIYETVLKNLTRDYIVVTTKEMVQRKSGVISKSLSENQTSEAEVFL